MEAAAARIYSNFAAVPHPPNGRLLTGDAESWEYYQAVESVPPPGFELNAIAGFEGTATAAIAPVFRISYRLDTPFQGPLRRAGDWIASRSPRLVSVPVIGIGSPMSDGCSIGFLPGLGRERRRQLFSAMLDAIREEGCARRNALLSVKSIGPEVEEFHDCLTEHGYARVTSVPVVKLPLPFGSLDEYLAALSRRISSYFKRKLRTLPKLRIEYRTSIEGLEHKIYGLFVGTLAQSKVDYGTFGQLDPAYFGKVISELGGRAQLMLCWHENELLGFTLFLIGDNQIIDAQIGMKYPEAREYNVYFIIWLKVIEFAIERRIPLLEMGATTYATKLLFGGHLERRWLYFRFSEDWANRLFRPLAPMFDFERNDPELRQLRARLAAAP
jgi:hypothetical protein